MSEFETREEFASWVREAIERVGRGFTESDDDWLAMLFVQLPDRAEVGIIPGEMFENGVRKDLLADFIRARVAAGAIRYGLLLNTFMKPLPTPEEVEAIRNGEIRVSELGDSVEALVLTVGDAEDEQHWFAVIDRSADAPPALGAWVDFGGVDGASFSGRFIGLGSEMGRPR